MAPIVLAAIVYNLAFSIPEIISNFEYQSADLIAYMLGSDGVLICFSIAISLLVDAKLCVARSVSWQFILCLSSEATVLGLPVFWVFASRLNLDLASFISIGLVSGVTTYSVWSILHLCIRSAERAVAQERRTAALRETMLRYENEALSSALDSGFSMDALTRIARALSDEAGGLAGEIVLSVAERMRAALARRKASPAESIDEAFAGSVAGSLAGSLGPAQSGELTDAGLRRLLLIGALGVWAAFFCGFFFMDISGGRPWWKSLSDYGSQAIVGALWFVFAGRLLQKAATYSKQALYLNVFGICALGIGACAIFLFLSFAVRGALAWPPLARWIFGFELNYVAPIFIGWAAVYLLIDARRREIARLDAAAEIREAALKAHNALLRQQVNPHFLFNALNALYALVLDRQFERARAMTAAVRSFLVRAADAGQGELVALSSELAVQDAYLEIERVRFGDRLQVERRIEPDVAAAKVPHLILQPLVENAVKYAVARTDRPVAIEIRARRAGQELLLAVADTGAPEAEPRPPGLGVGLRNVEARLKSLYGEAARLTCRPLEPAGFLAEVRVPLNHD